MNYASAGTKRVHGLLVFGIVFAPYIFAWWLLGHGYSNKTRLASFAWMALILLIVASGQNNPQITPPTQQNQRATNGTPDKQEAPSVAAASVPDPTTAVVRAEAAMPTHAITEEEFNAMGASVEQQMQCGGPCPAPSFQKGIIVVVPVEGDDPN